MQFAEIFSVIASIDKKHFRHPPREGHHDNSPAPSALGKMRAEEQVPYGRLGASKESMNSAATDPRRSLFRISTNRNTSRNEPCLYTRTRDRKCSRTERKW